MNDKEVEMGDEVEILVGIRGGCSQHSGFNAERDGQSLQSFEQKSDMIWLVFYKNGPIWCVENRW